MTFFQYSFVTNRLRARRAGLPLALVAAAFATTAAQASFLKAADSPLPIRTWGAVSSPRAFETSSRLVVTGAVRPALRTPSAHVDVQIVGRSGQVLAEKVDALEWSHPRTAGGRHGDYRFTEGFPLDVARQAAGIVVSFKTGTHAKCAAASSTATRL
jgi:hypothetical protein